MSDELQIRRRHAMRLRGYDYSSAGAYFVTVCVQDRECLFGEVVDGLMIPNEVGRMVRGVWDDLAASNTGVETPVFALMPNHVHGIVVLTGHADEPTGQEGRARGPAPTSLVDLLYTFKSLTTAKYRRGVYEEGWPPFPRKLWQRSYFDRIVRGTADLAAIHQYILDNPARWHEDEENPSRRTT